MEGFAAGAMVYLTLAALSAGLAGWAFSRKQLSCIESSQASYLRETSPSGVSVVVEDGKANLAMS